MIATSIIRTVVVCTLMLPVNIKAEVPSFLIGDWVDPGGNRISFRPNNVVVRNDSEVGTYSHASEEGGNLAVIFGGDRCLYRVSRLMDEKLAFGLSKADFGRSGCFIGKLEKESKNYSEKQPKKLAPEPNSLVVSNKAAPLADAPKFTVTVSEISVKDRNEHQLSGSLTVLCFGEMINLKLTLPFKDAASIVAAEQAAKIELKRQFDLLGIKQSNYDIDSIGR